MVVAEIRTKLSAFVSASDPVNLGWSTRTSPVARATRNHLPPWREVDGSLPAGSKW